MPTTSPRCSLLLAGLLLLTGCPQDYSISKDAICDGLLQAGEETVDAPFDIDGDGFFDASNPHCAETYEADRLDCDEGDPEVNPGATELACDGIDNDCNEETLDADDLDEDGYDACIDCDDEDPEVSPGAEEVHCNDIDDDCDESTEDHEDADGDGWNNCDDCDDGVAAISPSEVETLCNDIDDDCDELTPDDEDVDGDGVSYCDDDCDDDDAERYPGNEEICEDEIDNDCDDEVDEGCVIDYTGTWTLDRTVSYSCAYGMVSINFNQVFIQDNNPTISISSTGTGSQPGTMNGSWSSDTEFYASRTITGTCNETYEFSGTMLDATSFAGSFDATFTGSLCLGCTSQSWILTGTL